LNDVLHPTGPVIESPILVEERVGFVEKFLA